MNQVFTMAIDVRFRDLDAMGHVNNAVYLSYFEEGRKGIFFRMTGGRDILAFPFILARLSCNYLKPIQLDTDLSLQVRVSKIGSKSFDFAYRLVDRGDETVVFAEATSVQVSFDYAAGKSVEIPKELRKKLQEYLMA